jgi:hypothetical protein
VFPYVGYAILGIGKKIMLSQLMIVVALVAAQGGLIYGFDSGWPP